MFEEGIFCDILPKHIFFSFRFVLQGSVKCKARVVTNIIDGVNQIVLRSTVHNHNSEIKRKKNVRKNEKLNQLIQIESSDEDGTLHSD